MCKRLNNTGLTAVFCLFAVACGGSTSGDVSNAQSATAGATAADGGTTFEPIEGDVGSYFVSGAWHGYVWTYAHGEGTSITPTDFTAQTTGMPRCVKGAVGVSPDYSAIAILGMNLNEDNNGKMTVTPTKQGVLVHVTNNEGSSLQFQVEGKVGDKSTHWCALVRGTGGFIPWGDLNTACWDNSGKAYDHEPLLSAAIVVSGNTTVAVPFDFCLNALGESDGPGAGN
jgi:hypothetical protein